MIDRSAYELVFADDFDAPALDETRWVPHYLPQWTTPDRSAARYDLHPGWVRLRIDADQPAWRPEDGELRVSNLQTGSSSGPAGSDRGTHRHRRDLVVRSPHTYSAAWTPDETRIYVDDELVRVLDRGTSYPLQLMLDLFEFPAGPDRDPAAYPKHGDVAAVRGYRAR